ncbi:sigma-70 family RNA polymerase sigma factor [Neglectibacter caecimuris]|uniref:sigma-70 family RNA polymerase sigma factor n=1 Tax=Neglectibacter caecimuris TaxID=3093658 RepID=UPI002AC977E3|nr:sigma-70 family RNA polymerase sigma factor [Neglectibacter sp. M00184]
MEYSACGDAELCLLVREGSPDAFAELSSRYLRLIRAKAAQFAGPSAPEKEDLLQEGFLGLYAAAVSFEEAGGASFRTYAGICVSRRMTDAARRHGSTKNRPLNESLSLESEAAHLALESGPEDLLELRERLQALFRQMDTVLTPLERKALLLYLSGCKRSEVENRSGMSLRAFDNALYRVRNKLKFFQDAK